MDPKTLKLCVICCSAFSSASTVQSDAVLCREHLVSFCKLLANSPPQQNPEFDELLQKSFPGMDTFFEESGMSVCVDCHHQITVAMEKGSEAEKKEEEVRKLQLQILQQMKELQKQVDEFHEEMSKVEKVIQTSDVSCLMYHMAKNPSKNEHATNGIVLIRDRILDVMADLRDFQARQSNMLNVDIDINSLLNLQIIQEDEDFIPYIPQPDVIVGTEGLMEAASVPLFLGHTIFSNDGDFRYEASAKNNGIKGDSDYSKSEDEVNSSDSDVSILNDDKPLSKRTRRSSAVTSTSSVKPPRSSQKAHNNKTNSNVVSIPEIVTLKDEIVARAKRREATWKERDSQSKDPLVRYPLKYNAATDQLLINEYEIAVIEKPRSLKCVECGLVRMESRRVGNGSSMGLEWQMKTHVVRVHVMGSDQKNKKRPTESIAATRSSPRIAPQPQERPSTSTAQCQLPSSNTPQRQQHRPSTNNNGNQYNKIKSLRVCPVSTCRRTFVEKEDFIRHLQGHRYQNKAQRERLKPKPRDVEPEVVVLD